MKYYVTYGFRARYIAEVEADNIDEVMDMAETKYCEADFGEAEDIDGEPLKVEDENGNYIWEL